MELTLREYLDACSALLQAYLTNPTTSSMYVVNKYVRIPMVRDEKQVVVALRPKDVVEVLTINKDGGPYITKMRFVCSHNMSIMDDKMRPMWKNEKLLKWLEQNCAELSDTNEIEDVGDFM